MKKIYLISSVFIFFFVLFFVFKKDQCQNSKAKIYTINNNNYCLLTANNQVQREKGLMFYKKPVNFDGMIFIFPEKQIRSFWNENTYLDLDIYWMDDNKIVGKSFLQNKNKSKETITVSSPKIVNKIVEIVR